MRFTLDCIVANAGFHLLVGHLEPKLIELAKVVVTHPKIRQVQVFVKRQKKLLLAALLGWLEVGWRAVSLIGADGARCLDADD